MRPILIAVAVFGVSNSVFSLEPAVSGDTVKTVCAGSACVNAELADTADKRAKGLMFREGLDENSGMYFVFEEEGRHSFWMKNMKFGLDIIWIDGNNRIVGIDKNVLPCKDACEPIIPDAEVKYVLEVNSGFADRNRVKTGEEVFVR